MSNNNPTSPRAMLLFLILISISFLEAFHPLSSKSVLGTRLQSSFGPMILPKDFRIKSVGMPRIIKPGTGNAGDEWLIWFHGRDYEMADDKNLVNLSTGRIFHATSKNGINNWKLHVDSPVLNPSRENGDWYLHDSEHVGLGDVILPGMSAQSKFVTQEGVFLMYTFGGNRDYVTVEGSETSNIRGIKMEIGVAVSQDGAHWSRVEGDSPYGAILEVGKSGDFDQQFVGWPCVLEIGKEYRMYYHTYDTKLKKFIIAYASGKDGIRWKKRGIVFQGGKSGAFDEMGASRRHVVQTEDGNYKMFYEGLSFDGRHSIGLAHSTDGLDWKRHSDTPVFTYNSDSAQWDSNGVGSPHVIWLSDKKRWRLYYVGTSLDGDSSLSTAIGVAESTDEEGINFVRVDPASV